MFPAVSTRQLQRHNVCVGSPPAWAPRKQVALLPAKRTGLGGHTGSRGVVASPTKPEPRPCAVLSAVSLQPTFETEQGLTQIGEQIPVRQV